MTDLLTKEERRELEAIREKVASRMGYNPRTQSESREAINQERARSRQLLAIIDNLSKRGVKRYSENEVETLARKYYMIPPAVNEYTETEALKIGAWYDCVSALGALEKNENHV